MMDLLRYSQNRHHLNSTAFVIVSRPALGRYDASQHYQLMMCFHEWIYQIGNNSYLVKGIVGCFFPDSHMIHLNFLLVLNLKEVTDYEASHTPKKY